MIRNIDVSQITETVKEMCIQANHFLSEDMDIALKKATEKEESDLGKKVLNQLQDNLKIAAEEMIPICQDTGMAVICFASLLLSSRPRRSRNICRKSATCLLQTRQVVPCRGM